MQFANLVQNLTSESAVGLCSLFAAAAGSYPRFV